MPHYIVDRNAQSSGDHEVHRTDTCTRLPFEENQIQLGWFEGCQPAVDTAKRQGYVTANGCNFCIPQCHAD